MERRPELLNRVRGVLPTPVIVLIAVALLAGLFFASRAQITRKHYEVNKTEMAARAETTTQGTQKDKTDAQVTYAEFDTGKHTRTETKRWDRNTRTTTKRKTTHYAAGSPDTVVEEEITVDDISSKQAAANENTERDHQSASVTNVTSTTDTTIKATATEQSKTSDSHENKTETKTGSAVTGKAGLAITSSRNPAITWDVARVGRYSAQTMIEISKDDAAFNGGGVGISRDLTRDGRFFGGSNVLYGHRDGLKVGAHLGVRF